MTPSHFTILIVDDDTRNVFALKATLKAKGFNCLTSAGALEALKTLHESKVDLMLLDMMMPEMDGYETLNHLRKLDQFKEFPIVAVTAQAMAGDREKCLEAGATAYLSKPIDVDRLMEVLAGLLV